MDVVVLDDVEQPAQARFGLDRAHLQRIDALLDQVVRVVRVGEHRAMQLGCGPGELGKHQYAAAAGQALDRDEFLGDQVEPVAQRGDPHHLSHRVIGDQLLERDRPEEELQRGPADP